MEAELVSPESPNNTNREQIKKLFSKFHITFLVKFYSNKINLSQVLKSFKKRLKKSNNQSMIQIGNSIIFEFEFKKLNIFNFQFLVDFLNFFFDFLLNLILLKVFFLNTIQINFHFQNQNLILKLKIYISPTTIFLIIISIMWVNGIFEIFFNFQ